MRKNIFIIFITVIILLSTDFVYSDSSFECNDFIKHNNKIYYPIKNISDNFNYNLNWDELEKKVVIYNDFNEFEFKKDSNFIKMNDDILYIDSNNIIKDSKFYISLDMLFKIPEVMVCYDEDYQMMKFSNKKDKKSKDIKIKLLHSFFEKLEKGRGFSGNIMVIEDDDIIFCDSYGYADKLEKRPNNINSEFSIGSITKQFTALSILQLEQRGLISLDDKLSKFYPEIKNSDKISIHNMLIHSSGLKNYTNSEKFFDLDYTKIREEDIINYIKNQNLEFNPGEYFYYSNTNYLILSKIIENITNVSYEDYIKNNILNPLNMQNSGIHKGKSLNTSGYIGYLEAEKVDDNTVVNLSSGAANMYSTIEDMYKWSKALESNVLLKEESLKKMLENNRLIDFYTKNVINVGYGWFLPKENIIRYGGNTLGYTSGIIKDIHKNRTYIILSNIGYYDLDKVVRGIDIILDEGRNVNFKPHIELEILDYSLYDDYIGEYKVSENNIIKVFRKDNNIYIKFVDEYNFEIFYLGDDEFFSKKIDFEIKFVREGGRVDSLIINQNGLEFIAEKIK